MRSRSPAMRMVETTSRRSTAIGWRRASVVDGLLLDLVLQQVEAAVRRDHLLGQLQIALGERTGGLGQRAAGARAHLGDHAAEHLEVGVEGGDRVRRNPQAAVSWLMDDSAPCLGASLGASLEASLPDLRAMRREKMLTRTAP